MGYERPTFDLSKEEGALPPIKLNRAYERPGKFFSLSDGSVYTDIFISPSELMKKIKIYQENQWMNQQKEKTDEAISCLRYLF